MFQKRNRMINYKIWKAHIGGPSLYKEEYDEDTLLKYIL